MAKPNNTPNASDVVDDTTSDDNNAVVFIDASQDNNVVGLWGDCIIPHSTKHAERLTNAKARKADAEARGSLPAFKQASADVSKLSKWELNGATLSKVYSNLSQGSATLAETGAWLREGDGNGNAKKGTYKIVSFEGKLHGKVKDIPLSLEDSISIVRDGKQVDTKEVHLSEYLKHLVEVRRTKFRENKGAQNVMRGIAGHENTIFQDVPEPESIEQDADGKLSVTSKVVMTTTDTRKVLQDMIDSGRILPNDVKALPYADTAT